MLTIFAVTEKGEDDMPRYINADKLKEECYYYDTEEDLERYVIKHGYADVVPKSEVDKLHEVIFKKEDLMQKIAEERNKYSDELETVKDNNEHLAVMLEEAKSEVERLQAEKDALVKNYAECMKDYASEIFVEIEKEIDRGLSVIEKILNTKGGRANGKTVLISKYDVYIEAKKHLAELRKKYIGGNDDRL
jgi:predicted  nucleic acid-binding Zn-ribbon protein